MSRKTLTEWLEWQEKLTSDEIRLGLERVAEVALRLDLKPPEEHVFTVAGTNGKGSCATAIEALLRANDVHRPVRNIQGKGCDTVVVDV